MSNSDVILITAVFIASAVEMVEALTIVLAVGVTRGWRSSLEGAGAALIVLSVIVAILGPTLVRDVPINFLRVLVGGLLLIFGLQWMRKAILRASGFKDKRDEDAVYQKTIGELSQDDRAYRRDTQGFVVSFKGVFIEGLEVVIIVLTLGSSARNLGLASLAALSAAIVVALIGLAVSRQLSEVPENAMKLAVGVMLISFGTFWSAEGLGVNWPGNDLMIPLFVFLYAAITFIMVHFLRRLKRKRNLGLVEAERHPDSTEAAVEHMMTQEHDALVVKATRAFLLFWWDFLVGDTPEVFIGTVVIFAVTEFLLQAGAPAVLEMVVTPLLITLLLNATTARGYQADS